MTKNAARQTFQISHDRSLTVSEIIDDYRLACRSRSASVLGRKEVLTGKASFGIFGDGVELPQIALAKAFHNGDFRAGYYRDQTTEFALGNLTVVQFFSQLYADNNVENEPNSAGRQMNCHFGSRLLRPDGSFKNLLENKNTSADISPTGGQMARLLGMAYASKLYRNEAALKNAGAGFSQQGNEVAFGSIGDASTSEGPFFETMNAAAVLQVPLLMSVWDNGYGISVPRELQTANGSISQALSGFASEKVGQGIDIYVVEGWDYLKLCKTYQQAAHKVRTQHKPALVHVIDVSQPMGHSTSGSHERYKSKERLEWEKQHCCILKMRQWLLTEQLVSAAELDKIEEEERRFVEEERRKSWQLFFSPMAAEREEVLSLFSAALAVTAQKSALEDVMHTLKGVVSLHRRVIQNALFKATLLLAKETAPQCQAVVRHYREYGKKYLTSYRSHLYSETAFSPLRVAEVKPTYSQNPEMVDGRVVLLRCFDHHFQNNPAFFALGEDVGKLGDVNLVFEGLNAKYGDLRVTDTGIREATILGQGIGAALRGLRPLVDIQYLDYFLFALQTASDDLATVSYRTAGGQKAPVIIRTKGHRLEGIWHTGSPISVLLGALRGMYVCVPRNMTQAAGMYNTLLQGDNPALVIEVLNGYRLKEALPDNVGQFTVPLGSCDVLRSGNDITVVTYGPCCKVALDAADELSKFGIELEVIDVQTLLPFDLQGIIARSIHKTNAVLFFDEDVPGGTSAYLMQQVLERRGTFDDLDATPRTLAASESRGAYGRDGDYYCKPQVENVFEICYAMMRERAPQKFNELNYDS